MCDKESSLVADFCPFVKNSKKSYQESLSSSSISGTISSSLFCASFSGPVEKKSGTRLGG